MNYNLKRGYKISLEEIHDMLETQDYKCLLCKRKIEIILDKGIRSTANVDHNHNTGKVRGLLCSYCNTLVSYVENNKDRLDEIIEYIK